MNNKSYTLIMLLFCQERINLFNIIRTYLPKGIDLIFML